MSRDRGAASPPPGEETVTRVSRRRYREPIDRSDCTGHDGDRWNDQEFLALGMVLFEAMYRAIDQAMRLAGPRTVTSRQKQVVPPRPRTRAERAARRPGSQSTG